MWVDKDLLEFKVIRRIDFTSDRKRMSILVQDMEDGLFKLYCKWADNIIMDRLSDSHTDSKILKETKEFLNKASNEGYRTLLIAIKILDLDEVEQLVADCQDAESNPSERDEKLAVVYN